jgi:formylglycine-generating enzyme required for sulfatase activity
VAIVLIAVLAAVAALPFLFAQAPSETKRPASGRVLDGEREEEFEYIFEREKKHGKRRVLTLEIGGGEKLQLVRIPAGKFMMGSPDDDKDADVSEKPRHEVTISKAFYLGKHEVTRGQFRKFVEAIRYQTEAEKDGYGGTGYDEKTGHYYGPGFDVETGKYWSGDKTSFSWKNTGFVQTDDHPVVNVSWNDAKKFCSWLSTKEHKPYNLPTEAEWEYACRAGTTTRFYGGNSEETLEKTANIADASKRRKVQDGTLPEKWDDGYPFTAPVGKFAANPFGLQDMDGNVCEWCQDRFGEHYYANSDKQDPQGPSTGFARILRGGSFDHYARHCGAASRSWDAPVGRFHNRGFRVRLCLD